MDKSSDRPNAMANISPAHVAADEKFSVLSIRRGWSFEAWLSDAGLTMTSRGREVRASSHSESLRARFRNLEDFFFGLLRSKYKFPNFQRDKAR
jgi:hypothetical protein